MVIEDFCGDIAGASVGSEMSVDGDCDFGMTTDEDLEIVTE